eukprot:TRINITY_DN170_c0_g3_i1.p1 TRINITY_DN170_c0_g3~~TRINITY_DN170_c0_g3_i1.p1  ORF type:complete len:526 (-),score=115.19 TRINITY_DN170_c0_g3_i1:36-1613(-)
MKRTISKKNNKQLVRSETDNATTKVKLLPLDSELFSPVNLPSTAKRNRAAYEILTTEQTYVKNLIVLYTLFKKPMQESVTKKELQVSNEELNILFSNLEDIINVNTEMLNSLYERFVNWSDDQKLGDVLLRLAPSFRIYTLYSVSFTDVSELLSDLEQRPNFMTYIELIQANPLCNKNTLGAFLIQPIQRIPRYRLLLEQLQQVTPPEHVDYANLTLALEKFKEVVDEFNKAVVNEQERAKLIKVCKKFIDYKEVGLFKRGRKFIHEGELWKVCRKERQHRKFFVFSDVLIYAHQQPPNKYKVGRLFDLSLLKIVDLPDSVSRNLLNAFQIQSESKSFTVFADSPEEKKTWLDILKNAQNVFLKQLTITPEKKSALSSTAPVWVPDNEAKTCQVCSVKFSFTNRRHHCRQCGGIVCGACSNQKKELPGQGKKRVCTSCINTDTGEQMIPEIDEDDSSSLEEIDVLQIVNAVCDYDPMVTPNSNMKLKFKQGDMLRILQIDKSGWWLAELKGECGWIPSDFVVQNK